MSNQLGRVENTSLQSDIESVVLNNTQAENRVYVSATIHTVKEDIPVPKVLALDFISQYATETSGYGILGCFLAKGDFFYRVYPHRDNLEVSIKYITLDGSGVEDPSKTIVDRYKAIYKSQSNPSPLGDTDANRPIEDLNIGNIVELELELQEVFEEIYRFVTLDGVYNQKTAKDILEAAVPDCLNKVTINGKPIVEAIHVDEPSNATPYQRLVVPRGLLAKDVPGWLQERGKGVYHNGIGNFIERIKDKSTWFCYPLFDIERFNKDVEKLIVYFAPQDRYAGIENTYRKEGKSIYVVTTSTPANADNARNADLNAGNGFRMVDSTGVMTKPAEITETGFKSDSRRLNSEVVHKGRNDQANFARIVGSGTNQYLETSRVLARQFSYLNIDWEYGDGKLIYPGMPCKCIYLHQGSYEEKLGTVVGKQVSIRPIGNPMTSTIFKRDIELKLAIEPTDFIPEVQKGEMYEDPA